MAMCDSPGEGHGALFSQEKIQEVVKTRAYAQQTMVPT